MTERAERRRRSWSLRGLLLIVLAAQLVLVGVGLAKAHSAPELHSPRLDHIDVQSSQLPLTPELGLPIATQYAQQWRADARVVGVSMHLDWPETPDDSGGTTLPDGGFLSYFFVSGRYQLLLNLDRRSGNVNNALETHEGGPVWPTLDLSAFTKASTVAGLTAEVVGGKEYRALCPDQRHVSTIAAAMQPDASGATHPAWAVTYDDDRHGDKIDELTRIDAQTGEVITHVQTARGCDE